MQNARIEQVRKRVQEVFAVATAKYGLDLSKVTVRFDLRGRSAGMAGCKLDRYGNAKDHYMRFNVDQIMHGNLENMLNDTVPHEIAHVVCYMNPMLGSNHDNGWKRVCVALGGTGTRCHSEMVAYAKGDTYQYITTSGAAVNVSQQRHRRIQMGVDYTFRNGGRINKGCKWFKVVSAAQAIGAPKAPVKSEVRAPVAPAPKAAATEKRASKADVVRSMIADAKRLGKSQDYVIANVVATLGMTKSLARAYVKNNWEKA